MSHVPFAEEAHVHHTVEALNDRIKDLETLGLWKIIRGGSYENEDNVMTLTEIHKLYPSLLELATTNPWHIRGAQLRHSYIFGKRFDVENVRMKEQKILDDPHNRHALFSMDALETNNLSLFTAGNMVILYDELKRKFTRVPIMEVDGISSNPDDEMDIWYIRRTWTSRENGKDKDVSQWYPVARHKNDVGAQNLHNSIGEEPDRVPVNKTTVAFLKHSKRPEGSAWGVPDSLGAMLWTVAYAEYLSDNSKLVKALSRFAWNITRPDKASVRKTASEVHEAPGSTVGASAINAGGGVSSVGVPSAQVNFSHGQPLIAAVAASFGVPVIALISSPGATGGSYGAASTLDEPTVRGFEVLQDSWADFYEEILTYLGSKEAKIIFPPMQSDPPHRVLAALGIALASNLIHLEDASDFAYDTLGIRRTKKGLPPLPPEEDGEGGYVPGRGKRNEKVPGGTQQGDTDHSLDGDNE